MKERKKLKIVFAGTPRFSVPFLELLCEEENVAAAVTRPDRPAGRRRILAPPPVKVFAGGKNIKILQPGDINSPGTLGALGEINPDLIVVVSYGGFLRKPLLGLPPLGCLNIHPSLLPKYRGPCPVERALINGDAVTGVCSIIMDEGMDSGDILSQEEVGIDICDNSETLSKKLILAGMEVLRDSLEKLKTGAALPAPQDGRPVYAPFIRKDETLIDWQKPAGEIHNLVRALYPGPGARTSFSGSGERVIILESCLPAGKFPPAPPGEITGISKEGAAVSCGEGRLIIKAVQPEGGKKQRTADFLRGRKAGGFAAKLP